MSTRPRRQAWVVAAVCAAVIAGGTACSTTAPTSPSKAGSGPAAGECTSQSAWT